MKGVFYFFVKKELCGAKLIRWGTKVKGQTMEETPSHMGTVMNGMWSIDATLNAGVEMDYFPEYIKEYGVVAIFKDTEEKRKPSQVAADMMTKSRKAAYDYGAVLYYAYRRALNKFFGIKMPKKNRWESKNSWFCNEMYELVTEGDYSMASPNDVMFEMEISERFKKVELEDILPAK